MPSILFKQPWPAQIATLQLWSYRVGIFAAINLLDDPAWLALMFC
jgi:hypothetical protein